MSNEYSLVDIVNHLIKSNLEPNLPLLKRADDPPGGNSTGPNTLPTDDPLNRYMNFGIEQQRADAAFRERVLEKWGPLWDKLVDARIKRDETSTQLESKKIEADSWAKVLSTVTPLLLLLIQLRSLRQQDPYLGPHNNYYDRLVSGLMPYVRNGFNWFSG
jgi:hypothetical protein